jgi:hypothetical protein
MVWLSLLTPAIADHAVCGKTPEFESKSEETKKTVGDLQGKAEGLAKLVGSAELGGKISAERQTIYKNNQAAEAARNDAYLAYVFCVIIMDDNKLDSPARLKALQEFRKPLAELSISEKAITALLDSVTGASKRASEEAATAREKAARYPADEVKYTLKRVSEIERALTKIGGQPTLMYTDGANYWGEAKNNNANGIGKICCSDSGHYMGEFLNGQQTGYGKKTFSNSEELVARFSNGSPTGAGCISQAYNGYRWCGRFDGRNRAGFFLPSGIVMRQYFAEAVVAQRVVGEMNDNGYPEGSAIIFFLDDRENGPTGGRYEGQMKAGVRDGYGVQIFMDGTQYQGQWHDRKFQGFGKISASDGRVLSSGYWDNGTLQIPIEISK